MTKGITQAEIEIIVDDHLKKMFNPKAKVDDITMGTIREETLKLSQFFRNIINVFNKDLDHDDYVDNVLNEMDTFIFTYEKILCSIKNKKIASSIGAIWYEIFASAHSELEDNISGKMLFEYGESKINKLLLERISK